MALANHSTLSAIVMTQVLNAFLCRSPSRSVFSANPLSNLILLAGIALEVAIILAIDYTTLGNHLFGTRRSIQKPGYTCCLSLRPCW